MSKEHKYMSLIYKNRKDCSFTLAELAQWITDDEGITYSAARSKSGRLIKRLPCEAMSPTVFRLTMVPSAPEKTPDSKKEVLLQDQIQSAKQVVAYLNQKAGTSFRGAAPDLSKIQARMREGFTMADFKTVVDKKVAEWKNTEMEKYLRVETLFGSKMEGYLNAKEVPKGKVGQMANFDFTKYQS